MADLRVVQVISSSEIGGAERYFAALLKGLSRSGIELYVACPVPGPMAAQYHAWADRVWPFELRSVLRPWIAARLASVASETRADVVHTHLWNADALGGAAALQAGVPAVSTVYGAYHLPIGVAGLRGLRRKALSRSYRAVYTCFSRVIALSQYIRDDLEQRSGIRADSRKIEVISPGIELPDSAGAAKPRGGPARIVSIGNFFPIKGQEWLVQALPRVLARFPNAECILVGDGPDRPRIEALSRALCLGSRVRFAGSMTDPLRLLSHSDVFVLPSVSEGLPLSILEAWAHGVPVIAARAGGVPEAVADGESGLLVPIRDPAGLADGIIRVLSNPSFGRRLAEGGSRALGRFSVDTMVERTIRVYRQAAGSTELHK